MVVYRLFDVIYRALGTEILVGSELSISHNAP